MKFSKENLQKLFNNNFKSTILELALNNQLPPIPWEAIIFKRTNEIVQYEINITTEDLVKLYNRYDSIKLFA